jgi:hypothetical protein
MPALVNDPARLARAVVAAHRVISRVEVWSEGQQLSESASFEDGSVSNDWVVAGISRHLDLTVMPSRDWLRWFDFPNLEVRVFRGVRYSASASVECQLGVFPVLPPEIARPVAPVKVTADDYYQRVVTADFSYPVMSSGGLIVDQLSGLIRGALLPAPVILSGSQQVSPATLLDKTRHDAVVAFSKAGNVETIIDRSGSPVVRDARVLGAPTSEILTGAGEAAVGLTVKPDWSRVFNMVSVTSSAQGVDFPAQVVSITDPDHPAHPSRIGVRVKKYSSPLLVTADDALAAGWTVLARVSAAARSYTYSCFPNPTTDAGDSVLGATMTGTEVSQILNVTTPLTAKGGVQTITTVNTQVGVE